MTVFVLTSFYAMIMFVMARSTQSYTIRNLNTKLRKFLIRFNVVDSERFQIGFTTFDTFKFISFKHFLAPSYISVVMSPLFRRFFAKRLTFTNFSFTDLRPSSFMHTFCGAILSVIYLIRVSIKYFITTHTVFVYTTFGHHNEFIRGVN